MNTLATSYVFQAPHRLAIYDGMVLMAKMMLHVCDSIVSQTLHRIFYAKKGVICKNCILISFKGFLSLEMGQLRERIQIEAKEMW